jgi:hypothetical protein
LTYPHCRRSVAVRETHDHPPERTSGRPYYFTFDEATASFTVDAEGDVPTIPIYVTFNINPLASNPMGYAPLWQVVVYDDAKFDSVDNLETAMAAASPPLVADAGDVNCPIVVVASATDGGAGD